MTFGDDSAEIRLARALFRLMMMELISVVDLIFMEAKGSSISDAIVIVLLTALIYYFSYLSSSNLIDYFEFSHSTSWFYLPSGVRLLLTLVLMGHGALGVCLGTLAIDYLYLQSGDHFYNVVTALVAGSSAYLSLRVSQRVLNLDAHLTHLSATKLLAICAIFSIICPVLHQLWFHWRGDTTSFLDSFLVMAVGDLGGCLVVLLVMQCVLKAWQAFFRPS